MAQVKKRNLKLSKYYISKEKYNEMKWFCLRYWEMKKELAGNYGLSAVEANGMPRGNMTGRPTEQQAVRNEELKRAIDLIEDTAMEADESIAPYIMKSVTQGTRYEYMDVPMGRRQFYEVRRYFFYLLSKKKL